MDLNNYLKKECRSSIIEEMHHLAYFIVHSLKEKDENEAHS